MTIAENTAHGAEPLFFERAGLLESWLERHHGVRSDAGAGSGRGAGRAGGRAVGGGVPRSSMPPSDSSRG